jgi:hypothetical protein
VPGIASWSPPTSWTTVRGRRRRQVDFVRPSRALRASCAARTVWLPSPRWRRGSATAERPASARVIVARARTRDLRARWPTCATRSSSRPTPIRWAATEYSNGRCTRPASICPTTSPGCISPASRRTGSSTRSWPAAATSVSCAPG